MCASTMPDLPDHDPDLSDHDRPIPVITIRRSTRSRWAETRSNGLPGGSGRIPADPQAATGQVQLAETNEDADKHKKGRPADIRFSRDEKAAIDRQRLLFVVAAPLAVVLALVGVLMIVRGRHPGIGFALGGAA